MSRLAPLLFTMGFAVASTDPSWAQEGKAKADPAAKAEKDTDKAIPVWPGDAPGSEKWTRKELITGSGGRRTSPRRTWRGRSRSSGGGGT